MKEKRPLLLTIMCWFIIGVMSINLISFYLTIYLPLVSNPYILKQEIINIPILIWLGLILLTIIVSFWSGINMLKGKEKARTIYVRYNILFLILFIVFIVILGEKKFLYSSFGLVIIWIIHLGLFYLPSIDRYFYKNRVNYLSF